MIRPAVVVLAAAFALTACGQGGSAPTRAGDLNAAGAAGLGAVVTDAQGRTLYRFDGDTAAPPVSHCTGQCALTWPPVLTTTASVTLQGIDQHLVGTTTRDDGSQQVTLGGWPLYRYSRDTAAGQTTGQGAGGLWFAAAPGGGKATEAPSTSDAGAPGY
ncbi:hypothetical protein [Amycolatopsis sp. GM8]|uniref:hypothetical protein n=1 Tax=Amycolatopsis sp. GM8 TaxID=2896530 RepID=UPI001F40E560|nr:hypothetical protein [Amycolatopsis sp. GM8]